MALFRRSNAIARTVVLPVFQIGPFLVVGIQDLQFHPKVRRIPLRWRTDAQSVVGSGCEFELKAKNEVCVLLGRVQVSTLGCDRDRTVPHHVARGITHPAFEGLPIKERLKFGFEGGSSRPKARSRG